MKKLISVTLLLIMLCTVAFSESTPAGAADVTYRTLYNNMKDAMKETEGGSDNQLIVTNATVWKINDDVAGFAFQGDNWQISGEADMETGLITRIFCRLPYTKAGLLMTYMTAYVISEEASASDFISKYVGESSLLNGNPFPHYANTLDAGNETTLVYEFTRLGSFSLENPDNKCNMKELIRQIQQFKE